MNPLLEKFFNARDEYEAAQDNLAALLYKYTGKPEDTIDWDNIKILGTRLYWDASYPWSDGVKDDNSYSVDLKYFDDPDEYIREEKGLIKAAEEEKQNKKKQQEREAELETLKRLKEKYPDV